MHIGISIDKYSKGCSHLRSITINCFDPLPVAVHYLYFQQQALVRVLEMARWLSIPWLAPARAHF